jgi:hypothetical protein
MAWLFLCDLVANHIHEIARLHLRLVLKLIRWIGGGLDNLLIHRWDWSLHIIASIGYLSFLRYKVRLYKVFTSITSDRVMMNILIYSTTRCTCIAGSCLGYSCAATQTWSGIWDHTSGTGSIISECTWLRRHTIMMGLQMHRFHLHFLFCLLVYEFLLLNFLFNRVGEPP